MTDVLQVSPGTVRISTPERQPITFNFAPLLFVGETITDVVSEIAFFPRGEEAPAEALDGDPSIDVTSKKATQWIDAATLTKRKHYRLDLIATTTDGRRLAPYVVLEIAFY